MIDLGVGSGLKSQQDSLGCVSASLKQPKVVSFINFFVIQNLFKVSVTLALARGEIPSGPKTPEVEVSSIDFVVLDCSYDSFCAQSPLFTQHDILQVSIGDSNLEVKGLGGKTLSRRLINPVNIKLMEIKSNLILDFSGD